jgi:glycerol-3-phosphate dehydrogenase
MNNSNYDLLVIGGGINGTGIARDAQGRGLRVLLAEQHDLARHTSSASTKLIHGGLRYLEYYEFSLVRKALQEREVLLKAAPHIMRPLRFVMPHDPGMRPAWMIRLGLWLYDHLARRELLPGSRGVDLRTHPAGKPLARRFTRGFEYSDGWVDDARLVALNALDAAERGASIRTRTRVTGARREAEGWSVDLEHDGVVSTVHARALVNAGGPWAATLLSQQLGVSTRHHLRLVKGSHIIVPSLFEHDFAYIFQNPDGRIIFAIPYQGRYTLIGTTDVEHKAEPGAVSISQEEIAYLCEMASHYFRATITPDQVVSTYSGVRPLLEEAGKSAASVTRDYWLELDEAGGAPVLSVFGGKITTFRKLAEQAVDRLAPLLGNTKPTWTAGTKLPGGDLPGDNATRYAASLQASHPWLPAGLAARYAHTYGTRSAALMNAATVLQDLGREVAPGLFEAELRYLCTHEWAVEADDVLWRRTKLGLGYTPEQKAAVAQWLAEHAA